MGVIMVYKPTYNWGAHPVPYNGVSSHFRSLSCGERLDNSGCGQQNSKAGPISILPVRRLGRVQFLLQDILESHTFCYETILYIYILYIYHIIYIYHIQIILCVSTFAQLWNFMINSPAQKKLLSGHSHSRKLS